MFHTQRASLSCTAVLLLALAALGARAHATPLQFECPNTKATQVGASVRYVGEPKKCGLGLVVLGVGGGLVGDKCHPTVFTTPAHQDCTGATNDGTRCVPEGTMNVEKKECKCGGLVLPIFEIGIPTTCHCDPPVNSGTVEDFKTELCPMPF